MNNSLSKLISNYYGSGPSKLPTDEFTNFDKSDIPKSQSGSLKTSQFIEIGSDDEHYEDVSTEQVEKEDIEKVEKEEEKEKEEKEEEKEQLDKSEFELEKSEYESEKNNNIKMDEATDKLPNLLLKEDWMKVFDNDDKMEIAIAEIHIVLSSLEKKTDALYEDMIIRRAEQMNRSPYTASGSSPNPHPQRKWYHIFCNVNNC